MTDPLGELSSKGVSTWLDDLSRHRLVDGSPADQTAHDHVTGVTTNPTIFAKAITGSTAYAGQIHDLAARAVGVAEAPRAMTAFDVRWACDVLRPVFDATGGVDGRVSIEADPRLAYDTEATIAEARFLWWLVDRPNLFIKIPAARQGLPTIAACLAERISINITLIFFLVRYDEVIAAWLDGLERARQAGRILAQVASVASLFVSRVDTEVDGRLDKIGTATAAAQRGRAAIANARLAYHHYERMLPSPRWAVLAAAGARPQRPLWASTSVKDPAYPDTHYVTDLVAPGVVNTMPETHCARSPATVRYPQTRSAATTPRRGRCSASCRRPGSTTTTSPPSWSTRAWPPSMPAGRGWATSRPSGSGPCRGAKGPPGTGW
jgi:transaldolase